MTKQILVGGVPVGGNAPIPIQSMCNTRTDDVAATVAQIKRLEAAGCEIIRVAVPDMAAARAVGAIREQISIPLVVDIHFDYRLALEAVAAGADKVRINPGNIGAPERVKAVAQACRVRGVPIRIGVNGGSLEKPLLAKYGGVTPEALVESAFGHIELLHRYDFDDICVSLKSSDVRTTMAAYRLMSEKSDYPYTSESQRRARSVWGPSNPPSGLEVCSALELGTRSGFPFLPTLWRRCPPRGIS